MGGIGREGSLTADGVFSLRMNARYNPVMLRPRRVAVLLPNWVGDVVMATPALGALRRRWPAARITHVGPAIALETLAGSGLCDEAVEDSSRQRPRPANLLATAARLRRHRCELAVLMPNSFRSAALARLAGICELAGYDRDGRGWLLTHRICPLRDPKGGFVPVSMVEYYLNLARMFGADCEDAQMRLSVTEADRDAAEALLRDAGYDGERPLVMLNPGAAFGTSKMWLAERYAAVGDALIDRCGAGIIIHAAPAEREIARQVAETMRNKPLLSFAERSSSLSLLKALCGRCDVVVTNDTGARHVAAAMGAGVVTIFGSTDPAWARIDYHRERILRASVPCSPCQRPVCPQPAGPLYHQCMTAITVEQVLSAVEELLSTPTGRRQK
ncbi:MAG: lipopolysaccharide heptosyltransferase II [Phycisphaerae bacterium]